MYGFWAHNCLVWPCRCIDPHDPMLTATFRHMESMSNSFGGGMHSEGPGPVVYWPYIGVDRAIGHLVRGERDRALDYFCAYTDTAGGTFSWGESYHRTYGVRRPAAQLGRRLCIILFRNLFAFEDDSSYGLRRPCSAAGTSRASTSPSRGCRPISAIST